MQLNIVPKEKRTIIRDILIERSSQDSKWGVQNHSPIEWCAILGEEVGEVQKAALENHFKSHYDKRNLKNYKEELIQVAAVAMAMVESLERNELK